MTKIELSKTGFQINNITLEFPIDITILQQALGDYRYNKKKIQSHLYLGRSGNYRFFQRRK